MDQRVNDAIRQYERDDDLAKFLKVIQKRYYELHIKAR